VKSGTWENVSPLRDEKFIFGLLRKNNAGMGHGARSAERSQQPIGVTEQQV